MTAIFNKLSTLPIDFFKGGLVGGIVGGGIGHLTRARICHEGVALVHLIWGALNKSPYSSKLFDAALSCYITPLDFAIKGALFVGSMNTIRGVASRFFKSQL